MARKVILDIDPGIDDAVALAMALFDPRLEVEAVTAVAGNVSADRASRNVQGLVELFDPERWPRIGGALEPEAGLPADRRMLHGPDGLGGANLMVAELHHGHASDKLIADVVRARPGEVTIIALGPLTNIARVLKRFPDIAGQIDQIVICGGAVAVPGNVTPVAEFNIHCDPQAAREVFRAPVTKTLIPLDVTSQVVMGYDFLEQLPPDTTRVGEFFRQVLPYAFRSHHQNLGVEGIYLRDAVALVSVLHRELFTTEGHGGDVETAGELTLGQVVIDRRRPPQWRRNLEVATEVNAAGAKDTIIRGLAKAGAATSL